MFESMLEEIDSGTIRILFSLQIAKEENIDNMQANQNDQEMVYHKDEVSNFNEDSQNTETTSSEEVAETIKREELFSFDSFCYLFR